MARPETRQLIVTYEAAAGGGPRSGLAHEPALGGLFIETKEPLAIGALLSVEISGRTTSVTMEARVFSVRKKREGKDKPVGMSVRFIDLPTDLALKLKAILDEHRPPSRTQVGVGDEQEALWASAGGREAPSGIEVLPDAPAAVADEALEQPKRKASDQPAAKTPSVKTKTPSVKAKASAARGDDDQEAPPEPPGSAAGFAAETSADDIGAPETPRTLPPPPGPSPVLRFFLVLLVSFSLAYVIYRLARDFHLL